MNRRQATVRLRLRLRNEPLAVEYLNDVAVSRIQPNLIPEAGRSARRDSLLPLWRVVNHGETRPVSSRTAARAFRVQAAARESHSNPIILYEYTKRRCRSGVSCRELSVKGRACGRRERSLHVVGSFLCQRGAVPRGNTTTTTPLPLPRTPAESAK